MGDRVGQQLGNYRLIHALGQGGFAAVYLGEHLHLRTQAAVKVLNGTLTPQDVQAFTREAQTIAAFKHPHILRVLDFGFDGNTPFLVMEVASQGTLRDRHPRGSVVPPLTIVSYVKPVAAALQYAHERKVIHRDVKPENILVDGQQTLLLSDFGIAAMAHSPDSVKTLDHAGTPHYMAPEQIRQKPCLQSDQYALAVVVYEWMTGQRPFQGDNQVAIWMQHLTAPVPPLREKNPAITPAIEQVVLKALAKDANDRFDTVQAFAVALELVVQSEQDASTFIEPDSHHKASAPPDDVPPSEPVNPSTLSRASSPAKPGASPAQPPKSMPVLETRTATPPSKASSTESKDLPAAALTLPPKTTVAQSARKRPITLIDGEDVLRRVRRGDIPSTWRVIRIVPKRVHTLSFFYGFTVFWISGCLVLLLLGLVATLYSAGTWESWVAPVSVILLFGCMLLGFLAGRSFRATFKNMIVVLLPEGFIYGNSKQQKASLVINYTQVAEMHGQGGAMRGVVLRVTLIGEKSRRIVIPYVEDPKAVALSILDAYADFQIIRDV